MKASFSEYLSAREDWVQDILGYYTKLLLYGIQLVAATTDDRAVLE